ncbi:MAG: MBL fold metallo-hydrolase [Gemmatimonadaceae bacterium]|nr:MBL fold metallo-hydrolase [Gemmatimonadaceae bacterium]
MTTRVVAEGITLCDLHHMQSPEGIATALLETADGVVIIDPGPTSTLGHLHDALRDAGSRLEDVKHIVLTHIHLDHAGASGTLVAQDPTRLVYVHERGATHMADPSRLLRSAARLYGDRMEPLWGEFRPVPASSLRPLTGGESLKFGRRVLRVEYTPGHAQHHISVLDERSGTAFVGDTCGEQLPSGTPVIPTVPPPDIDLALLAGSITRIRAWGAERLFLTHFGPVQPVSAYLDAHDAVLARWAALVLASFDAEGSDDDKADAFADARLDELRAGSTPEGAALLRRPPIRDCWFGLARYLRSQVPG